MSKYILTIDQGTSGTKTIIFDNQAQIVSRGSTELKSIYPTVGFVEQDPEEIYQNVLKSVKKCVEQFRHNISDDLTLIKTCAISNQRETFVLWDKKGNPLYNAVVWQCKRSVDICNRLKKTGIEEEIISRTGLKIDPYFSGTKVMWLNENNKKIQNSVNYGKAFGGTIDTWLLFKLTNGSSYYTDYTNASRTLFFNINELNWDSYLLNKFVLQNLNLPEPHPSAFSFGSTTFEDIFSHPIEIAGMIGDSHAAAFGEGCFEPGNAKVTLGTGSSILMNTGDKKVVSKNGMVSTICWSLPDRTDFALEGIIVSAGATIKWLRDQLGFFSQARDTEAMAASLPDNNGVYLIPAFSGLGAPHWKMNAKAEILGLTFAADKRHIVRAALESIPFQIKDVITAMEIDAGIKLNELKSDGGITANKFVMQFMSDLLNTPVINIGIPDVSALGAAFIAGLHVGMFKDLDELRELSLTQKTFVPGDQKIEVQKYYKSWQSILKSLN
jgi:glycerol kinase